jgi:hypothetical protein
MGARLKIRPFTVAVVGWLLVARGAFGLYGLWITIGDPASRRILASSLVPDEVQVVMNVVGFGIDLFCGAGILAGQNWARLLYVGWGGLGVAVGLAATPHEMPVLIAFLALAAAGFILFRKPANLFFGRRYFKRPARRGATSSPAL